MRRFDSLDNSSSQTSHLLGCSNRFLTSKGITWNGRCDRDFREQTFPLIPRNRPPEPGSPGRIAPKGASSLDLTATPPPGLEAKHLSSMNAAQRPIFKQIEVQMEMRTASVGHSYRARAPQTKGDRLLEALASHGFYFMACVHSRHHAARIPVDSALNPTNSWKPGAFRPKLLSITQIPPSLLLH